VVVVENHQRHSQHMEDWFLYNREFTFDQYLFREKTMNNRSHHSLEKIPNTKKKKFNFSLRIPAVWSFFFADCLFLVVVDDDDSMSSLLVIKPTFIIRCVMCTMRSSIYSQYIYMHIQADIVANRSMSSSTSLRTLTNLSSSFLRSIYHC